MAEIEQIEQRPRTVNRRFTVQELAADARDAAELPDLAPLAAWVGKQPGYDLSVNIPEQRRAEMSPSPMFDPNAVYSRKRRTSGILAAHRLRDTICSVVRG